ncbi:MAG: hypothetical protein ACYC8T_01245 [Myxococcaceae bacterium]
MLLLHAVTVTPATLPARGRQEAIVKLDGAAMVRVSARSASGTSCVVVDHVRGPFANSGVAGKSNCELDLLLDAGTYKLRLLSKLKAKGQVKLEAVPFAEVNAPLKRLQPRSSLEQQLHPGQQASYWLRLDKRQPVALRVSGRTAGLVRLWRAGEWLENVPLRDSAVTPRPGQPLHEWWLEGTLDEGDYLVTAYGTGAHAWTGGKESDLLSVEYGFRQGPVERGVDLTLPAWGFSALEVPKLATVAFASLEAASSTLTELSVAAISDDGAVSTLSHEASCRIEPKALIPECSAVANGVSRHLLMVRGAPGTRVHLEWSGWIDRGLWSGGFYGGPAKSLEFEPTEGGDFLVGVHDIPPDFDEAPLSCQLDLVRKDYGLTPVGRDSLSVEPEHPFERQFNYDGQDASIWFEVKRTERYRVATGGGRKSRCELWRVDGSERKRLTETKPDAVSCNLAQVLSEGRYELSLYGGTEGIEKLSIREDSQRQLKASPTKSSCLVQKARLEGKARYRLTLSRAGRISARGLVFAKLPLVLTQPLHLTVDGEATLKLPLSAGAPLLVRAIGGRAFSCGYSGGPLSESRDGLCRPGAASGAETLVVQNRGAEPISVALYRPVALPEAPALTTYAPTPRPITQVPLDAATFFDFDRGQSHSMVFEVEKAGLYHVTTQGLLQTSCRIRTPVVPALADDSGGGRGRNCLVAGYLRPGRYMLTVATVGRSKGRGAVLMTRRAAREAQAVASGGDAFFRVDAGDLIQQKLYVKNRGAVNLSTTGQGVSLRCRLDDKDGWPVVTVPTACAGRQFLQAGQFLWTQLPLTVESMRRTKLEPVRPPLRLAGSKPHPVDFHIWYDATLGKDGKDEFLFTLAGELEVQLALTGGMQGRLYLLEKDKPPRMVDIIPPQGGYAPPSRGGTDLAGEAGEEDGEEESPPEESYEEEGEGYRGEGEEEEGEEGGYRSRSRAPVRSSYQPLVPQWAPPPPPGHKVLLPPGQYQLEAQHSRGDVAIRYRLHLGTTTLMPGMARELPVPSKVALKMPADGTLRLRTVGEADVRCRLFDGAGHLVFEGSENGADWNCALAEPLKKGEYQLVLETETQTAGSTRLLLSMPRAEDPVPVADGMTLKVGANVVVLEVPVPLADAVQDVELRSRTPFSCALEDAKGEVVHRQSRVKDCSMLVRPGGEKLRVRVWTTDGAAEVSTTFLSRVITPLSGRTIAAKGAALATIPRAGRYATSGQVYCLPGAAKGLLRPCGPEVSLEAGPVVLSTRGPSTEARVPLEEVEAKLEGVPRTGPLPLSRVPFIQGSVSSRPAVHLVSARVAYGERFSPSCAIDGYTPSPGGKALAGVREGREASCYAASGVATQAIGRLWAPGEEPLPAELSRLAVALPSKAEPLGPGRKTLTWTGQTALYDLPTTARSRVELTVPKDAWVVLLDGAGAAVDLCAPEADLSRCVVGARGGRLLVYSPTEQRAEVTVLLVDAPERIVAFTGLYEEAPRAPGSLRLKVPPAESERTAQIEGAARCVLSLGDGMRITGCRARIPARLGAELLIEHGTAPLRAMVHLPGRDKWARLGVELPATAAPALSPAVAIPAAGARVDRSFTLDRAAMVRLKSETGVCGLFRGNDLLATDGLDAGCEIDRLLTAGTYRWVVRPFGAVPLLGTLSWTLEPVANLTDGVGPEEWISPAQTRLYRFATASQGKVGLGVQVRAEQLDCRIFDEGHVLLGEGCQQYLALEKGSYLLSVSAPPRPGATPLRYRPVLLGLAGAKTGVPDEYLRDFFRRIGEQP